MTTMLTHILPPNTQAILLLCASFGQNRASIPTPLTLSEYNILASWLQDNKMTPADLLDLTFTERLPKINIGKLDSNRLVALLERGMMLSLAVEKWTNQGLWILGRSDAQYPKPLKQKLKTLAPPILYGVGNIELLSGGGLAIVGSRDVDEEGLSYIRQVVETCSFEGIQVVSGGARGVDQASMLGTLETEGTVVGVLADSLAKSAVAGKYRQYIKEGRLTLVSPYDPNTNFSVGNAMGRNKYIYALSDHALVISSSVEKGGTWAGAVEALSKIKDVPVFVRMESDVPEGNRQLINLGAKPFPETPWNHSLKELLVVRENELESTKTEKVVKKTTQVLGTQTKLDFEAPQIVQDSPKDILYKTVLSLLLEHLEKPKTDRFLADFLDIQIGQMRKWLKRAVEDRKVRKNKNPVTYEVNRD